MFGFIHIVGYLTTIYVIGVFVQYWRVQTRLYDQSKWFPEEADEISGWPWLAIEWLVNRASGRG